MRKTFCKALQKCRARESESGTGTGHTIRLGYSERVDEAVEKGGLWLEGGMRINPEEQAIALRQA
jgi:hypothetical protein